MRRLFAACPRWSRATWFWPLALLALPGCSVDLFGVGGGGNGPKFNASPGTIPLHGVVFCDIEKPSGRHCASQAEINALNGLTTAAAAEALVAGQSSGIALDESPRARAQCPNGEPQVVEFEGPFPDGKAVCANCSVAVPTPSDARGLCMTTCEDLTAPGAVPPPSNVVTDCQSRTHVSVNAVVPTFCFGGVCSPVGNLADAFVSPRRSPEPVRWQNLINVTPSGVDNNTLEKRTGDNSRFDAGAASDPTQAITSGDAYVDFTVTGPTKTRLAGLSSGTADTTPDVADVDFGIDLFKDSCFYIFERGVQVNGPIETCTVPHAFGAYTLGDRFRVSVKDNFDNTATVSYARVTQQCLTQVRCDPFYTSAARASYPLRVDTSFHDINAMIGDVVLVRIRDR